MDILRKMFQNDGTETEGTNDTTTTAKDSFRKPQWFEESETDDELFDDNRKFAFQVFTNPIEMQKHFEQQLQQILEAMTEFEDNDSIKIEKNLKDEFLKPGFESNILKEFEKHKKTFIDTDLDGEIYADQLHSLMQRLNGTNKDQSNEPIGSILPRNDKKSQQILQSRKRLSDEETILGRIHGTLRSDEDRATLGDITRFPLRPSPDMMMPSLIPRGSGGGVAGGGPFGGVFEGTYNGPKMFSQSVVTRTTRKPDGTYETTKITQDSHGNKTTTITRTLNGKSETVTSYDNATSEKAVQQQEEMQQRGAILSDRNVYVSKDGYALPRNLW